MLRQLIVADSARMFEAIQFDPEHLSRYGDRTAAKYDQTSGVVDSILNPDPLKPGRLRFGIWDGDAMVGSINLTPVTEGPYARSYWKTGEVGYWLGGQHLGRGYARRALALLAEFAFSAHEYDQLIAKIHPDNQPSIGVVRPLGFVPSGIVQGTGVKRRKVFSLCRPNDPQNA